MYLQKEYVKKLAGINSLARHKEKRQETQQFWNPLIHKQIHGSEVYVPLDLQDYGAGNMKLVIEMLLLLKNIKVIKKTLI